MNIRRFYDSGLAHASYSVLSNDSIALIDPGRDPQPYLDFAEQHNAQIIAIIETHPHADFVSSHVELHERTGASIYVSKLVAAEYPHVPFDDGDRIILGNVSLTAINTPGHSPDSICVLLRNEQNEPVAVFTGDTLFVGDVGRPDLREDVGNITEKAETLARQLYRSTRERLMTLPPDVIVYPAHGPGSLCGKNMSAELQSTIGNEVRSNYALQTMNEEEFVTLVTEQQPFVPKYFGYDVMLNKKGAPAFLPSIAAIPQIDDLNKRDPHMLIVDGRPANEFKAGHLRGSINIPDGLQFETWLGTIVGPDESFYLLAGEARQLEMLIAKAAKIGYEQLIAGKAVISEGLQVSAPFNLSHFTDNQHEYSIVDVRNHEEVTANQIFSDAINIPLNSLREQAHLIPLGKPVAVHCAGGYRSAIASSIIAGILPNTIVFDISSNITDFTTVD